MARASTNASIENLLFQLAKTKEAENSNNELMNNKITELELKIADLTKENMHLKSHRYDSHQLEHKLEKLEGQLLTQVDEIRSILREYRSKEGLRQKPFATAAFDLGLSSDLIVQLKPSPAPVRKRYSMGYRRRSLGRVSIYEDSNDITTRENDNNAAPSGSDKENIPPSEPSSENVLKDPTPTPTPRKRSRYLLILSQSKKARLNEAQSESSGNKSSSIPEPLVAPSTINTSIPETIESHPGKVQAQPLTSIHTNASKAKVQGKRSSAVPESQSKSKSQTKLPETVSHSESQPKPQSKARQNTQPAPLAATQTQSKSQQKPQSKPVQSRKSEVPRRSFNDDVIEQENRRRTRGKVINYKEPPLGSKLRRESAFFVDAVTDDFFKKERTPMKSIDTNKK